MSGQPVRVRTNCFAIRELPRNPFYHYDVILGTFKDKNEETVKEKEMNLKAGHYREVMDQLFKDHPKTFNPHPCYDGKKNMYSSHRLEGGDYDVKMPRSKYKITITLVNTIQPSVLKQLVTRGQQPAPANSTAVNLLQIIVSQAPNLQHNFAPHVKSFFISDTRTNKDLSGGLQVWGGLFQSVRPVLNKLIINVDTTTAAVYRPGSLLDNAVSHTRCRDVRELVRLCDNQDELRRLKRFYDGVMVRTKYNGRKYKIEALIAKAGKYEFQKGKNGPTLTITEYYKDTYNQELQYPEAFGVRVSKVVVLPAEVCEILPGQVYKKTLDSQDTTQMLKVAVKQPRERLREIKEAVSGPKLNYISSPWMKEAGLSVNPDPLQIAARLLNPPAIKYGGEKPFPASQGCWNVLRRRFWVPARIRAWAVVSFDERTTPDAANRLALDLATSLEKLGITFYQRKPAICKGDPQNVSRCIQDAAMAAVASLPDRPLPPPGLIVALLPQHAAEIRMQIKQWGDMRVGIPTQCLRGGKWEKSNNDQYLNNVALKINVRCGGINSVIETGAAQYINEAMIVGCDVSHPPPGVKNKPSIASIVASVDPDGARYHAYVDVQNPRQEVIDDIASMLELAILEYERKRNTLPKHLLIYRDGVSEGEYAQVEELEIKPIQGRLDEKGWKISLIFIIVSKRHHIRFFPDDQSCGDTKGNCKPGLVVDSEVVSPTYPDFYLQSHAGILGTSRPSHYVILKNTPNLTEDQIQQLSYALCHVYQPATRAVSIPAPVYYADRACARAEFQFNPEARLTLNEAESNASGEEFDLNAWRRAFGQAKLAQAMYFV